MRRLEWGGRRRLRAGVDASSAPGGWGSRPGLLRGSAFNGWTRDRKKAGNPPDHVPGSTAPQPTTPRWRAERRRDLASSPTAERIAHKPPYAPIGAPPPLTS